MRCPPTSHWRRRVAAPASDSYRLTTDEQSQPQIEALPHAALAPFAEVRAMLEVAPWAGDPLSDRDVDTPVRTVAFGPHGQGLVTYLILERDHRVDLLDVLWLGP